jgi:tetratricopeptide (TPR) repeat protein
MVRLPRPILILLTVACFSGGCAPSADTTAAPAALTTAERDALVARAGAPLFDGMGEHHNPITVNDPGAQRYFNQGMVIDFAFNHAEATRSFRAAQTLDPDCAMCFWGEALALGPNINVTFNGKAVMDDDARAAAYAAIQQALALRGGVTQRERDLIDALAVRYNGNPVTEREPLDIAYADAMRGVHARYPDDDDAAALFAEAVMTTMPWDYWIDPENPKPNTAEVIAVLEDVLERSPGHPLALHLYIHAVEASSSPARAEAAADRLANLVPGAGHLVHMPSHIYWRVGRYNDASEANVRAAAVDEAYIAACNAQGFYPAAYYPHNIHFLWAASAMEGRSAVSIEAGKKVAANVQLEMIEQFPGVEFFHTIPLLSLVRFAKWDEILATPAPPEGLEFSRGIWHYARGIAMARTGDIGGARAERDAIEPLLTSDVILSIDAVDYPASNVLLIAEHLLLGEADLSAGNHVEAIEHFRAAVHSQDELPYTEPPFWYYPTRQTLGQALLETGDAAAAEQVYREDLEIFPQNGWSLFGLIQSLEAQGKDATAEQAQFDQIWARADVTLSGSRM